MKVTLDMIHPELRRSAAILKVISPPFNLTTNRLAYVLSGIKKGKTWTKLSYEQVFIDRADGTKLRICIYRPQVRKENVLGLLWMHGGGYGIGFPEQVERFYEWFIEDSNCVIVSPDYTLSIHKPYPAALDDCYLALKWMKQHALELGINVNQLALGGESAGGGLCAALSLYARDQKEVEIAFQIPLYPMLNDRNDTLSAKQNNAPVWNAKSNIKAWKIYLKDLYGTDDIPIYAAPFRNKNYQGLPPTITYVGTVDPFYDETTIYINHLKNAGIATHYLSLDGCYHSFDIMQPKSKPALEAKEFLRTAFKYAVKNYFKEQKDFIK